MIKKIQVQTDKDDLDTSWNIQQQLGRNLISLTLSLLTCAYSNTYLTCNTHESFLCSVVPQQLPQSFKIKPSNLAHGSVGILSCIALGSSWEGSQICSSG